MSALPRTGPPIVPIRKLVAYSPETRPRFSGGEIRISRPSAETVNMVDPMPPRPRNTSNCQ